MVMNLRVPSNVRKLLAQLAASQEGLSSVQLVTQYLGYVAPNGRID
jgi:hypothetical protein